MINETKTFKEQLVEMMLIKNGPLLHGDILSHMLGYSSNGAMRTALCRNTAPINLFELPHRQGKFALSEEAINWVFDQRIRKPIETLVEVDVNVYMSDVRLNNYFQEHDLLLHESEIMSLLMIDTRKELLVAYKKNTLPFTVFTMENRRTQLFALLPEVLWYLSQKK